MHIAHRERPNIIRRVSHWLAGELPCDLEARFAALESRIGTASVSDIRDAAKDSEEQFVAGLDH